MVVLEQMCAGGGHLPFQESLSYMGQCPVITKRVSKRTISEWLLIFMCNPFMAEFELFYMSCIFLRQQFYFGVIPTYKLTSILAWLIIAKMVFVIFRLVLGSIEELGDGTINNIILRYHNIFRY